ncbi:hypothetical protein D9758_000015 [Tetrapyrgos nigripes]|uniref:Uncharacterized protein n=1 Tax=Tetrapyrgos nigripes TaxID=182062 RepID=A0A8H5H1E8_9AGAR|nr:hypothetical protein D9758_000015 [Tetrapyrgos nigripes]
MMGIESWHLMMVSARLTFNVSGTRYFASFSWISLSSLSRHSRLTTNRRYSPSIGFAFCPVMLKGGCSNSQLCGIYFFIAFKFASGTDGAVRGRTFSRLECGVQGRLLVGVDLGSEPTLIQGLYPVSKTQKENLGTDARRHPITGQVSCNICETAYMELASWMLEGSYRKRHLSSKKHTDAIKILTEQDRNCKMAQQQYQSLYNAPAITLTDNPPPLVTFLPAWGSSSDFDINGVCDTDFQLTPEEAAAYFPSVASPQSTQVQQEAFMQEELERLRFIALEDGFVGDQDDTVPALIQEFQSVGRDSDEDDYEQFVERLTGVKNNPDYAPYESKTMCYLDLLNNLPRLRLSSSQMKMVLWIMRECGAKDVPCYSQLRETQKHIRQLCGVSVTPHTSDLGNIFYTTDDLANPEVAPHIQLYPEDKGKGPISETWQVPGGRWHELPLDCLPPSILVDEKRFYIHEVAQLRDGSWFIPQLWLVYQGRTHADGFHVLMDNECHLVVTDNVTVRIDVSELCMTHEELTRVHGPLQFHECHAGFAARIPNVNRQIDNGEDLYTIWVPLWADDVSGAVSKQYQKHMNVYMLNANLPGVLLHQEYFVRFVSTSPLASALELLKPIMEQINARCTHKQPIRSFNVATQRPCGARLQVPDLPADNPQQSEESSHIGHQGLCKCRQCFPDGENGFHASVEGYSNFYKAGAPRNVTNIRSCVLEQLRLATYGIESHVEELQKRTGTKDKIAQHWIDILIPKARVMQAEQPNKSKKTISDELLQWLGAQTDQPYSCLLDVDHLDPSQDTLVEILHTILLGTEKYKWHGLHLPWTEQQQSLFTVRLQSTNTDGLLIPPIRAAYMMQYRNGLIGKHFKTLMQTLIFHVADLVDANQLDLVKATGQLGAHVWMSTIDDLDTYLEDLEILIGNVLDAFANIDPSKILIKIKLHILIHLPMHICRRGPAVRFATEIFECFNAIFRMCSVLSNHQAPSRDIAVKFADLDRVKHIFSGGFWKDSSGKWVQGGKEVQTLLRRSPLLQKHLGWSPKAVWVPGSMKAVPQRKSVLRSLTDTLVLEASNPCGIFIHGDSDWLDAVHVTAVTGDQCRVGSFAVFRAQSMTQKQINGSLALFGRIVQMLLPSRNSEQGILVIEEFKIGEALHPKYGMPVTSPAGGTQPQYVLLPSQAVQFIVNVQHDCRASDCQASKTVPKRQERQDSGAVVRVIVHNDDRHFIINTHALHNASLLRKFLPRYLTVPRPLYADRVAWHRGLAEELVVKQAEKAEETKRKAAETRKRNKLAKEATAARANCA